jgi:hypothetical protein
MRHANVLDAIDQISRHGFDFAVEPYDPKSRRYSVVVWMDREMSGRVLGDSGFKRVPIAGGTGATLPAALKRCFKELRDRLVSEPDREPWFFLIESLSSALPLR